MSGAVPRTSHPPAFGALSNLLTDMARVVAQLTPDQFAGSGVAGVSGSIGAHVRHCLEHVRALELGLDRGLVDYDLRRRDTIEERDRETAVLSLLAAASRLNQIGTQRLARAVVVRSLLAKGGPDIEAASTVAREVAFVINHTIHHSAQIALLAHRAGARRLPTRFGMAPATPALTERASCAP